MFEQIKVKLVTSYEKDEFESMINNFICEEIENCQVKDIKFSAQFIDENGDYAAFTEYRALILYV